MPTIHWVARRLQLGNAEKSADQFKREKLLYAGTMTGGRYVVGRTFKCLWDIYAIPADIVTMYKPSILVPIGTDCNPSSLLIQYS